MGWMYRNVLSHTGGATEVAGRVNTGMNLLSIEVGIASSQEFDNDAMNARSRVTGDGIHRISRHAGPEPVEPVLDLDLGRQRGGIGHGGAPPAG